MGCFSCFDSPAEEQLNPKLGGAGGYGGSSSAAAGYGAGSGGGRHGDRGYQDLQQAPMVAPRVEKLSAAAEKARVKSNALAREASAPKDANGNVISAQTFTFRELATATRNFRPECFLGEGGFGRVYRGRLESTGQVVAIKQLNRDGLQGNREFLVEVLMLSLLHHQNLVNLIGYCAPEYAMTGQLTVKSDVYSFGVVLLELITGRRAIDSTRPHGEQNLVSWARPLFNDRRKLPKMADPRLEGRYPMRGLYQALAVASMCIQSEAASRPLIADVVTALILGVPVIRSQRSACFKEAARWRPAKQARRERQGGLQERQDRQLRPQVPRQGGLAPGPPGHPEQGLRPGAHGRGGQDVGRPRADGGGGQDVGRPRADGGRGEDVGRELARQAACGERAGEPGLSDREQLVGVRLRR